MLMLARGSVSKTVLGPNLMQLAATDAIQLPLAWGRSQLIPLKGLGLIKDPAILVS